MNCPNCHEYLGEEIGCEKTVACPGCGGEWKYGPREAFDEPVLIPVEPDDPIYWDR